MKRRGDGFGLKLSLFFFFFSAGNEMERIRTESDLSVFGQSAAMQQFISLLKCGDLSLKLLRYLLQGDSMKRADTVYCVVLKP